MDQRRAVTAPLPPAFRNWPTGLGFTCQKPKSRLGAKAPETIARRERHLVMTALKHWTEVLRCANCGLTGVANVSHVAAIVIDTISEGFRAVSSEYGDTFFCEGCNRPATEIRPGRRDGSGRAIS